MTGRRRFCVYCHYINELYSMLTGTLYVYVTCTHTDEAVCNVLHQPTDDTSRRIA